MTLVQAKGIKKSFDGRTEVLRGVDLTVYEGDFLSILGASGSGKSTLLTILGGMDYPTEGSVIMDGRELNGMKEKELAALRRRTAGFVFQFFNLAPYLTARENVYLPLVLDGKNPKAHREKFDFLMDYLRLGHVVDKMPAELSGGEQQRTAIARALIYEPKIIFLDEPTGNLDSTAADEIMRLLADLNVRLSTTIVQVTHSEQNASFGNRIVRISDGLITEDVRVARAPVIPSDDPSVILSEVEGSQSSDGEEA
ncbi:MAG: ABC transporter ATP-binding protein [Clostridia bacterium]|nr:ABC transporter ATP-binding protein [Clostridia bacterium]